MQKILLSIILVTGGVLLYSIFTTLVKAETKTVCEVYVTFESDNVELFVFDYKSEAQAFIKAATKGDNLADYNLKCD